MSLIHWWPLNGNTKDLGFESSTVTMPGATVNSIGFIGQCYTTTNASRGLYATFDTLPVQHPVSITGWYNITTSSTYNPIFSYGDSPTSGLCIRGSRLERGDGSNNYDTDVGLNVTTNKWQHIAVIYDGTNLIVYQNGVLITSIAAPTSGIGSNNGKIRIGSFWASDSSTVLVNDFRIYDHALSHKEVKEISKCLVVHYDFEDEYLEATTNLCNSITPAKYSGWGTITPTNLSTNSYRLKNIASSSSNLSVWDSWGYNVSSYIGQKITFSATIKDIQFINTDATTSWFAIGQANNGTYPNHIVSSGTGNFIQYTGSDAVLTKGTRLSWTGTLQEQGRLLFEMWTNATAAGGYVQLDLENIQIELKDHATPYVSGTRSAGKIYDDSGYSYNGTCAIGNVSLSTNTMNGQHSAYFNGSTKITNSYNTKGLTTLTYMAWVYLTARHSERSCVCIGGTYFTINQSGQLSGYAYGKSPAGYHTGTTSIPLNAWTHIAIVWDESYMYGYINGVQDFKVACTGTFSSNTPQQIGIEGSSSRNYTGYIADFKIYTTALSADDILEEYECKASVDPNGRLFTGKVIEGQALNITKTEITNCNTLIEPMTLSDGSLWVPICVHNVANGLFSANNNKYLFDSDDRWNNFGLLNDADRPESGYYEFYVMQQTAINGAWQWYRFKQNKNPLIAVWSDVNPSTVGTNVVRIDSNTTNSYAGMYWVNSGYEAMCFANGSNGNWWGCGVKSAYSGGIPGYNGEVVKGWQLVYLRVTKAVLYAAKNDLLFTTEVNK